MSAVLRSSFPEKVGTPDLYMETDANQWSTDASFLAKLSSWNYQGSLFSSYDQLGGGTCSVTFCTLASMAMLFQSVQDAQTAYAAFEARTSGALNLVVKVDLPNSTPNFIEECL